MNRLPFLFDAVLFDLDGTLVATERFWVDAARAGAVKAFAELGITRALPSAEEWMSLVGLPLAQGFDRLFADLTAEQRALVLRRCVAEETDALRAGQAALLPGVAEALAELQRRGVKIGIASNCGADYLDAMLGDLGLARWASEGRCLDTPGVRSKSAMVADLLKTFGTRAAVMVGDRQGDRDAAWANGLPHVHLARGFAQPGEEVEAEATIETMAELIPRLEVRGRWIANALETLGFDADQRPASLGITGPPGAGKTLFTRDVVRILATRGVSVVAVALEEFPAMSSSEQQLSSTAFVAAQRPLDLLLAGFDVERIVRTVLEPHARGEPVELVIAGKTREIQPNDVLVVQGPFLVHPLLRPVIARILHLEAGENVCLRRLAGRDALSAGPDQLVLLRRQLLPAARGFDALLPPRVHADLVLEAENPFGPA